MLVVVVCSAFAVLISLCTKAASQGAANAKAGLTQATGSNQWLSDRDALRAAIAAVTRRLKEQGVKTSLIARSRIIALAIEHLRSAPSPNA
jgi:hypothetical protein